MRQAKGSIQALAVAAAMDIEQGSNFAHTGVIVAAATGPGSKVWHHNLENAAMATCEGQAQHHEFVSAVRA